MLFASREDAGRKLARHLTESGVTADVVLGLPRGGVVVAAQVAEALHCALDVAIVRKIGHPQQREFAVGAISEHGVRVLDPHSLNLTPNSRAALDLIIQEEEERLHEYERVFRPYGAVELRDKKVLLVDDGLATGATMEAAALAVHKADAIRVMIAVPVASPSAVERIERLADEVVVPVVDPDFLAVGSYYESFGQTTSEEVVELLAAAHAQHFGV